MPKETGKKPSPWKNIYIRREHLEQFTTKKGTDLARVKIPEGEYAGYTTIWPVKTIHDVDGHPELVNLGYIPGPDWNFVFQKYDTEAHKVVDSVNVSSNDIEDILAGIIVPAPPRPPKK